MLLKGLRYVYPVLLYSTCSIGSHDGICETLEAVANFGAIQLGEQLTISVYPISRILSEDAKQRASLADDV